MPELPCVDYELDVLKAFIAAVERPDAPMDDLIEGAQDQAHALRARLETPVRIAFAGFPGSGKSSLINALTGRKALARASNTPGRTQEINYFTAGPDHYLVDLPGYGFAQAPVAVVEKWQRLLRAYLAGRQTLRRVFVLIDTRHGIKAVDDDIMALLDKSAVAFQVVMTKADKVKPSESAKILGQVRGALQGHPAAFPEIILTSSEKGDGIETLRAIIAALE